MKENFKKEDLDKASDRRSFLKMGIALGASSIAGSAHAASPFHTNEAEPTGETVKLLSPEGELIEVDKAFLKPIPSVPTMDGPGREGVPGRKFVMVIDLASCNNARKCHDACEKMHHLPPEQEWLKVLKMQDNENSAPYWQPTVCFHCDVPPCTKVCPVDATFKRDDGLVLVDAERCIGCRFCMAACPYSARVFQWDKPVEREGLEFEQNDPEISMPQRTGTVSKCDFCPDMARKGELPHCVTACPNGVFYFGDENEDAVSNGSVTVKLSELLRDRAGYRYKEEFGLKPRVYYLPPSDRLFPFEENIKNSTDDDQ